ncbi:hypothetical protein MAPG_04748 [Magnaporthiopsis poae ATCC 64411]|uniref:CFEM domain-containing protein n=1 Tax=Magnaporthiopsis poae (strain ATCC 64411 / 73-15) TaxID=644358 RepID=A0A0C4DXJ4_MAGP6|nr:hypothetical protein MAPG_04748 [Magnaporthiopsis poae ATCC 64411]
MRDSHLLSLALLPPTHRTRTRPPISRFVDILKVAANVPQKRHYWPGQARPPMLPQGSTGPDDSQPRPRNPPIHVKTIESGGGEGALEATSCISRAPCTDIWVVTPFMSAVPPHYLPIQYKYASCLCALSGSKTSLTSSIGPGLDRLAIPAHTSVPYARLKQDARYVEQQKKTSSLSFSHTRPNLCRVKLHLYAHPPSQPKGKMKFSTSIVAASVAAFAGVAAAEDCVALALKVIPSCAQTCFLTGAPTIGCQGTDFQCQCKNQPKLMAAVEGCVQKSCPPESYQAVIDGGSKSTPAVGVMAGVLGLAAMAL